MKVDVSILFVNYNTIKLLINAIDSVIEKSTGFTYEIIVVDNDSSDNSQNILLERYGEKVIYLALNENIGFGRANNEGIKIADGRNIFLLNPDTILRNNAIKILTGYIDTHPKVGVCGGNLFDENGHPTYSFAPKLPSVSGALWSFFGGIYSLFSSKIIEFNYTKNAKKVGYISGADFMIRKSILDRTGAFDPDFFMYGEEAELTTRIRKCEYDSINIPQAEITHLEGKSIGINERRVRLQVQGRKLFFEKTYGSFYNKVVKREYYLLALLRMRLFQMQRKQPKYEEWKLKSRLMKEIWFQ